MFNYLILASTLVLTSIPQAHGEVHHSGDGFTTLSGNISLRAQFAKLKQVVSHTAPRERRSRYPVGVSRL